MKMTPLNLYVPLGSTTMEVEVAVTATKIFWCRLWLGKTLLLLAARVLGCGIEFKSGDSA